MLCPSQNLNLSACEEFIQLAKDDQSRHWDLDSAAALCPNECSNGAATAEFLVQVSQLMKDASALDADAVEAALNPFLDPAELLKRMGGLGGVLGLGLEDGEGAGDKKIKSKYQFK
jgi:hypothetical protein